MKPEVADTRHTLEYAYTHDQARKFLTLALFGIALGLVLAMPMDGVMKDRELFASAGVIILALGFLAAVVYRRTQPNIANLVISPEGIRFRPVSESIIPWQQILSVTRDKVSSSREIISTKVVRLELSPAYYEAYTRGKWLSSTTGRSGDPSAIFLAYGLDVPHDELFAAVHRRWLAFSPHAMRATPAEDFIAPVAAIDNDRPLAGSRATPTRRRGSVIERSSSFEGLKAFAALLGGGNFGRGLVNLFALTLIAVLLANLLGYWSTEAQVKGRAEAAKWKAWHEERDREQREFDAEQKRINDRFDRMYKCMDETFRRRDLGISGDPECAQEDRN